MHQLQRLGIFCRQGDARLARMLHLAEELVECRPSLVVHKGFGEKDRPVSAPDDANAEINILSVTHGRIKSLQRLKDIPPDTHIETARIELVELLLPAPDAARRKKRSHGIADGFLNGRKRRMSTVWTAKRVRRILVQRPVYRFQIGFRKHDIRIQYQQIIALALRRAVVARPAWPAVRYREITDIELLGISLRHVAAWSG